jgi:CBS domain-containing protein
MEVQQLMTRGVRTVAPGDTMNRAAQIMWENDCGIVPVVDGDGRVAAMITDRDICMAAYMQGRPLGEMAVTVAASRDVVSVREHDEVETAEHLMQQHQIRRVPVVDANGLLCGMLSMADIARSSQLVGKPEEGLSQTDVGKTIAAISQPHHGDQGSGTATPRAV